MDNFEHDDLHDEIMKSVIEYSKATEHWEKNYSVRAYTKVSQNIRRLRKMLDERQKQVRQQRDEIWSERRANRDEEKVAVWKNNHLNFKKGKKKNPDA